MFALTGITGNVGGAVARTLLDVGRGVRANRARAREGRGLAAEGCDTAGCRSRKLRTARHGVEGMGGRLRDAAAIFDPTPGFPDADAKIAILRQALERSRPAKVVSVDHRRRCGSSENLLNQLRRLEAALADLPVPVTFCGRRGSWTMPPAMCLGRDEGVIRSHLPADRASAPDGGPPRTSAHRGGDPAGAVGGPSCDRARGAAGASRRSTRRCFLARPRPEGAGGGGTAASARKRSSTRKAMRNLCLASR